MSAHTHTIEGAWPYREPENTAGFCCEHVFTRSRPVLYVRHDQDGDWQFLCGDTHDGGPRLVCLGCVIERDPSLLTLADLPAGWGAIRERLGATWMREANADEDDDDDA